MNAMLIFPCSFQCVVCNEYLELKTRRETVKCHYCNEAYVTIIYCPNRHFVCPTCNHMVEESLGENAVRKKCGEPKTEYGLSELDGTPSLICYWCDSEHRKVYDQFMEKAVEYIWDTIRKKIKNLPKEVEDITPKDAEAIENFLSSLHYGL